MMVEEKMDGGSFDETAANIAAVRNLFPQAVREGKIDFDVLKTCLGGAVEERKDFYRLLWNGKEEARAFSRTRSQATLLPCRAESKNWDETQNLYIEGDNLEVLKLLQGAYHNQVKMIYIDPPYNTGKDFVYHDNFHDSVENYKMLTGQVDAEGKKTSAKNAETSGRYHTDWLNMIFPRLLVARNLLRDDGVIFISIDDSESDNLKKVCNEVLGEDNFIAQLIWQNKKGGGNDAKYFAIEHEYVMVYAKNREMLAEFYERYSDEYAKRYKEEDEIGKFFWDTFKRKIGKQYYPIKCPDGSVLQYDEDGNPISWLRSEKRFRSDKEAGEIKFEKKDGEGWSVFFKQRMPEGKTPRSLFETVEVLSSQGTTSTGSDDVYEYFHKHVFSNPKPVSLISFLMQFVLSRGDLVFDFFSGSGTTAEALIRKNTLEGIGCKYVLVQLPEDLDQNLATSSNDNARLVLQNAISVLDEIGASHHLTKIAMERIRRAGEKVVAEWRQREAEKDGKLPLDGATNVASVQPDVGFRVFKLETSNIVAWNPKAEDIEQELINAEDNIVAGRTREDLLYEILLKSNVMLTARIEERKVAEKVIYVVDGGKLMVALDDRIGVEVADEMARIWREEIGGADAQKRVPPVVVFRETGFRSDEDKANALTTLKSAGFETVRTV